LYRSKEDESSVSSLSSSESIWEKGLHFPENVSILTAAKPAIKSNHVVTRSSPRQQRQAKQTTLESPTISVLSPIKKRRLLVEDSGEVEIAIRKEGLLSGRFVSDKWIQVECFLHRPALPGPKLQGSNLCLWTHMQMPFAQEFWSCS
jgi:hypothetical protein